MVYKNNIPQSTDKLSQSQPDLLGNFQELDASFGVDHTSFSVGTNVGYHKQITFQDVLGADPNQTAPISSLYSKGSSQNLFYQYDSGSSDLFQLTGDLPSETGNDAFAGNYTLFFLPWNMKLFMGATASHSGSRNYTLSGTTGFGSTIYTSQCTTYGGGAVAVSFSPNGSAKTFNITTGAAIPTRWMVITN